MATETEKDLRYHQLINNLNDIKCILDKEYNSPLPNIGFKNYIENLIDINMTYAILLVYLELKNKR